MRSMPAPRRSLGRAVVVAVGLTVLATFGFTAEDGVRAQTTDRALGTLLLITLPLAVGLAIAGSGRAVDPWVVFGADRRKSLVRYLAPLWYGLPLTALGLSLLVLGWTRGWQDPHLLADMMATAPVAVMATLSLLSLSLATFAWLGRVGLIVLVLVLITFGRSELLAAAALPSAHVRHLLGVGATLPFDPGWSMAALWAFALLGFCGWLARTPR